MIIQTLKHITFILIISFFFSLPAYVNAQVVINEFSSEGNDDWIELYNSQSIEADLKSWKLLDTAESNPVIKDFSNTVLIPANGYCLVDVGNRLNNQGDRIRLLLGEVEKDCVSYGNGNNNYCGNKTEADVNVPEADQTVSRSPNGSGMWRFSLATREYSNDETLPPANLVVCIAPTPSPSPTPSPTPAKSPSPSPTQTSTPTPDSTRLTSPTPTPEAKKTNNPRPIISPLEAPKVLGETSETLAPVVENKPDSIPKVAYGFIGIGGIFLAAAAAPLIRKEYTKLTRKNGPPPENNTTS